MVRHTWYEDVPLFFPGKNAVPVCNSVKDMWVAARLVITWITTYTLFQTLNYWNPELVMASQVSPSGQPQYATLWKQDCDNNCT